MAKLDPKDWDVFYLKSSYIMKLQTSKCSYFQTRRILFANVRLRTVSCFKICKKLSNALMNFRQSENQRHFIFLSDKEDIILLQNPSYSTK